MARFTSAGGDGSGAPGPQGPAGDSAYDIAVQNGFVGTEQEWLDSLSADASDIADFIFTDSGTDSTVTLPGDKNMQLSAGTTSDLFLDAGHDAYLTGGRDVFIQSTVDDIHLSSNDDITISTNVNDLPNSHVWILNSEGQLVFPDNTVQTTAYTGGAVSDIADFVFTDVDANNSSMTITGDKEMTVESGAESDLNVRAGDQLWLTAGNDVILQADDQVNIRSLDGVEILSNYVDMGNAEHRWEFGPQGYLTLPAGGQIINTPNDSSDGGLLSTLMLVPDTTYETNQVIVIDPTGPNHIHLRAGGTIDESTAELILGGERNKVVVSDSYKSVSITTAVVIENTYVNANEVNNEDLIVPDTSDILIGDNIVMFGISYPVTYFSPDPNNTGFSIVRATGASFVAGDAYTFVRQEPYENSWQFGPDGVFSGPAMGGVKVPAILNTAPDNDLFIYVNGADADLRLVSDQNIRLSTEYGHVILNADGGEFIGSSGSPENQIATIGDIDNIVSNGTVRYSPTFTATGLEFTGSGETYPTYNSYYVKSGRMVSFVIEVDCSTVTNFGTGQYRLELPFLPAIGYNHFSGWAQIDTAVNPDVPNGHVILNVDHAGLTSTLDLHYLKQAGGAHTPIIEGLFLQGTPVTLTTSSKIYINGTYIMQDLP